MKIAAVQLRSHKADIDANLKKHLESVALAAEGRSDLVIFPELSITGYEPSVAKDCAFHLHDIRLQPLAQASIDHQLIIAAGLPIISTTGIQIGMVSFLPDGTRQVYTKEHLHHDELAYFQRGDGDNQDVIFADQRIAYCICYELSVEAHASHAAARGADIYVASVAKDQAGVSAASQILSSYAEQYDMPVIMTNAVGTNDDFVSAGMTSVWTPDGSLLAQMDKMREGLLLYDTKLQLADVRLI